MKVNKRIDTKSGTVQIQIADGSAVQIQTSKAKLGGPKWWKWVKDLVSEDDDKDLDKTELYEDHDDKDEEDAWDGDEEDLDERVESTLIKIANTFKNIQSNRYVESNKATLISLMDDLNNLVRDVIYDKDQTSDK